MNARTLSLLGLVALAGCRVPNDASIRLHGMCYPPTPTAGGVCAYKDTCESLFLGGVSADVASGSLDGPLVWPMQVDNQRANNADRSGGVDTATAWVEGYKIGYAVAGVPAVTSIPDVEVSISRHPVDAEGSTVVIAPVVPASVGTLLYGLMADGDLLEFQAELKAFGHYADGTKFETGPFQVRGHLGRNVFDVPFNDPITGESAVCKALDPTKPIYAGSCPQALQSGTINCIAAPAAP